jgi:hypothetical protein
MVEREDGVHVLDAVVLGPGVPIERSRRGDVAVRGCDERSRPHDPGIGHISPWRGYRESLLDSLGGLSRLAYPSEDSSPAQSQVPLPPW